MRVRERAFGVALAVAVTSLGLLLVASARGWLGPDQGVGRFCEASRDWILKQPANSLSNLGFVVAGLLVAQWVSAGRNLGTVMQRLPGMALTYAVMVVLLGPCSMAMHATQTRLGGRLDLLSMYLVASFAFAYAVSRVARPARGSLAIFAGTFVAGLIGCEVVENLHLSVPLVGHGGDAAFAALLIGATALEATYLVRSGQHLQLRWGLAALGSILIAFAIWLPSHDGGPLCDPHSLLQGHAVWHVLGAVAALLLTVHWRRTAHPSSGQSRE